jgi:hypothetical protein
MGKKAPRVDADSAQSADFTQPILKQRLGGLLPPLRFKNAKNGNT